MATRNIVPRADNEGSLGLPGRAWQNVFTKNLDVNGVDVGNTLSSLVSRDASGVVYDPTESGLEATNVQAAIDEVYASIPSFVTFDTLNTNGDIGTSSSQVAAGNHTHAVNDLSDVTITSAVANDILIYDGSNWVDKSFVEAGIAAASHTHAINDLSDVTITAATASDILIYDGSNWVDKSFAEAGIAAASHTHSASDITSGTLASERLSGSYDISITGNAATATTATSATSASTADKLSTPRTITLDGDVSGSQTFDGSSNITITTTVGNYTHSHSAADISYTNTTSGLVADDVQSAFDEIIVKTKTINVANTESIQTALDSIKNAWIPRDATVTISLGAGQFDLTSAIVVDHPCGNRINIVGATPLSKTASGIGTVTGSNGAWSVPITVDDVTDVVIGQYAVITGTAGTGDYYLLEGIWEITAVDDVNNVITITHTLAEDTFPEITITAATITIYPTVISCTGCSGFLFNSNDLGLLNNVLLIGDGTDNRYGLHVGATTIGAVVNLGSKVAVTGFDNGVYVNNSRLVAPYIVVSSNDKAGVSAYNHASIDAPYSVVTFNGTYGFSALNMSSINAFTCTGYGNASQNYIASEMSYINIHSNKGAVTCSPTADTVGNKNSIISLV